MTVAPRLRQCAGAPGERVIRRHLAIGVQADDLAVVIAEVLGRVRLELAFGRDLAIAKREVQITVPIERDLAAEMIAALRPRLEQLLQSGERRAIEAAAHERGRRLRVGCARLREGEIDEPVRREIGMRHHFEQAALGRVKDFRYSLDRLRQQLALADDPQAARSLGHQHVSTRQEGDGPRLNQPVRDRDHPIVMERRSQDGVAGEDQPGRHRNRGGGRASKGSRHRALDSLKVFARGLVAIIVLRTRRVNSRIDSARSALRQLCGVRPHLEDDVESGDA